VIRAATLEDAAELARLHALSFAQAWDEKAMRGLMESPGILAFLSPCGFVMARVAADEAEILAVGVEPAARRSGRGAALVVQAAQAAWESGARAMFLEVATGNDAAQALYRRLGFRETGRRKAYYATSEDALILRADLPLRKSEDLD
jgi:[ribosomal protein S18]-alanine N-acetyltransferase